MVRDAGGGRARRRPALVARIAASSREVVPLDAQAAALALFGDAMPANLLLVGAAYQAGALPLSAEAIEWAIELNGVAVAANTAAFRWGRVAVADPAAFAAATAPAAAVRPAPLPASVDLGELAGETRRLAEVRAAQLVGYQGPRTAQRYVRDVLTVWRAERAPRRGHRVQRGGRPGPAQAHRVQGRVRGGPPAHRSGLRGVAGRRGAGWREAALPAAPAGR